MTTVIAGYRCAELEKEPQRLGKACTASLSHLLVRLEGTSYRLVDLFLHFFRRLLSKFRLYRSWAFYSFSYVSGSTSTSHFFHLSFQSTGPLYSVGGRDAVMGTDGLDRKRSNGAIYVDD